MTDGPHVTAAQRDRRPGRPAALVCRVVEEACNRGELTILDELAPHPADGGTRMGSGGQSLRQVLSTFREAVPDARWHIVEQIAERNTVVTRLSVHGTFSGRLLGLASPGRQATLNGVAITRFARGRLVALWLQADLLDFLQQLGVLPALALTQAVAMAQVLHVGSLLADEPAPQPSPRSPPPIDDRCSTP